MFVRMNVCIWHKLTVRADAQVRPLWSGELTYQSDRDYGEF